MNKPIQIAVVGHTNAGKTSLLRTLTRMAGFGEVSDRPGTTRHVEAKDIRVDGRSAVRFFDTPGLEDSIALSAYLHALGAHLSPPERVRRFLQGPEASGVFEQEAKVLRYLLEADAALYVLDTREPALPKFRAEMDILTSCARPILPVLNFVAHEQSRIAEWSRTLPEHKLHGSVAFDVVAPATGAEEQLYRALVFLLPERAVALQAVWDDIALQTRQRRQSACRLIAQCLIALAALRREAPKTDVADAAGRQRLVEQVRSAALSQVRRTVADLLEIYGFQSEEVDEALLPWTDGRWEADLFNPQVLRDASMKLGAGAAIGAAIGLVADVALAGLSLGAATTMGAAIGGVASQGFGALGRKLLNKARGIQELSLENEVLWIAARQMLGLLAALERRGHAAQGKIAVSSGQDPTLDDMLKKLVAALQPARGFGAPWADSGREALADEVARMTAQILAAMRGAGHR